MFTIVDYLTLRTRCYALCFNMLSPYHPRGITILGYYCGVIVYCAKCSAVNMYMPGSLTALYIYNANAVLDKAPIVPAYLTPLWYARLSMYMYAPSLFVIIAIVRLTLERHINCISPCL